MALKNQTDTARAAGPLERAIARHIAGASAVRVREVSIPSSNGMSSETVMFRAEWSVDGMQEDRELVARIEPAGDAVFPRYDLALEFAVMRALERHTAVPVPGTVFSETDSSLLGGPFIVLDRVAGRVPSDDPPFTTAGWLLDLTPDQQARLYRNAVDVLAQIHSVSIDAVGLQALRSHPEAGLDGQLRLWRRTFEWAADGDANPTVEAALRWIDENRPAQAAAPVLNWGDARIGNILFDEELCVRGVLDWEMLSYNARELDLGWWLFIMRYYTEGIGAEPLPGFPDSEGFLTMYEQLAGVTIDREVVHFYEVFAATRLSILMHRAGNLMVAAGQLPPEAPMRLSNPASHTLSRLLDLPAPEGMVQSFAGNR